MFAGSSKVLKVPKRICFSICKEHRFGSHLVAYRKICSKGDDGFKPHSSVERNGKDVTTVIVHVLHIRDPV